MPRPKKQAADATAPVPVRFSKRLRDGFKQLADSQEIAQQDAIRLAAEIGLKVLAKVDFDPAEAVARYAFQLSGEDREELERLRLRTADNVIDEPENHLHGQGLPHIKPIRKMLVMPALPPQTPVPAKEATSGGR